MTERILIFSSRTTAVTVLELQTANAFCEDGNLKISILSGSMR